MKTSKNGFASDKRVRISDSYKQLFIFFTFFLVSSNGHSQTLLNWEEGWHRQDYVGYEVRDYYVPNNFEGIDLVLVLRGADGGVRTVKEIDGAIRHRVAAGAGATIAGTFRIGNGLNEIPPGSMIRMIVGQKGEGRNTQSEDAGGGGGGTAILYLPPGAPTSAFVLLAVAGGGGGAYSNCCTIKYKGQSAEVGTSGSGGRCSNSDLDLGGGANGNGGNSDDDSTTGAGAGGGAFTPGQGGCATCVGGAGGGTDNPFGGRGGFLQAQSANQGGLYGGYGYGAGGQGSNGRNGGGGGGYSGGGVCETQDLNFGGGGGGGSYINEDYASNITKIKNTETTSAIDGYIEYAFDWCYTVGSAGVSNPEECDAPNSGAIYAFTDPCESLNDVQLKFEGNTILPSETRPGTVSFTNLAPGEYTLQEARGEHIIKEWSTFTIGGDGEAPQLSCKIGTQQLDNNSFTVAHTDQPVTITVDDIKATASDNCGINRFELYLNDPITNTPNLVDNIVLNNEDAGVINGTLYAVDHYENKTACNFSLYVEDIPYFPNGCDANVYLLESGTRLFYPPAPDQLINRAIDFITPNESLVYTWDLDLDRFYCEDINQTNTLDLTVTDEVGNQTTCTANITVLDTIPAEVRCKALLIDLDENGRGNIDYLALFDVVTDNCLSPSEVIDTYSWNDDLLPLTVDCSHLGSHDITLHSTTDIYGAELPKCSATVTVRDPIQPIISCRDTTFVISSATSTTFTLETLPINFVSDNCTDNSQLRFDWTPHDNFRCEDVGTTPFWVQVNDQNGNSARCEFNVNILEPEIEESFSCRSNSVHLNASNNHSYTLQIGDFTPSITSFCGIPVSGTVAFSDDTDIFIDCEDIGEPNPVTLIFTPDDGSPAQTCITNVSIREISHPQFTCPSGIIDIEATFEDCGAYFEYDYTVRDNCPIDDLDITYEQGLPSGSIFPLGWNNVKISARDKSGNYSACNFVVRVAAPSTRPTLTCPDNYTVNIEDDACSIIIDTTAIFDQNCLVINEQNQGTAMGSLFEIGTHTFGFRTRNQETGLSSQCTFQVTVDKADKRPIAVCKEDVTIVLTSKNMQVNPAVFDGGSYDNCYDITQWTLFDGRFATSVFSCGDLGEREYELRVTNSVGISSTCTTHVTFVPETPQCQDISITLDEAGTATLTPEAIFIDDSYCTGTLTIDQTTFTCDDVGENLVTLTRSFSRNGEVFNHHCTATVSVVESTGNPCPNDNGAKVNIKVVLQGAYNATTRLMNANLRTLSDFPLSQDNYRIEAGVLDVTGNNAIVDWVSISLRDALDNTAVVFTRPALLQADGDVVDMDGVSPIHFQPELNGTYYVVIDHRNHLGLMTATTQAFTNPSTEISIDFTSTGLAVYGGASRIELATGIWGCYAADADGSGTINASDRSMTWNDRNQSGYLNTDYNLDGMTNANDRSAAWNNRNKGGTLPD